MIQDELTQAVEMGVISFDMSTRVGMEIDHLRAELDNRQMQLDGEHTTCVELSRQVYDLEEELAQAHSDIATLDSATNCLHDNLERKDAAIKELLHYNRIANDLDAYLADVAGWGLGDMSEKPKSSDYGLESR